MLSPDVLLLRAGVLIFVPMIVHFSLWFIPERKGWFSNWGIPAIGFCCWFAMCIGAVVLSRTILEYYMPDWPKLSNPVGKGVMFLAAAIGLPLVALLPLYAVSLSTQLTENLARRIMGKRPHKIIWFKWQDRRSVQRRAKPS